MASQEDSEAVWDDMEKVLSESALADMASDPQLLLSLSALLSSVASTMSSHTQIGYSSSWGGASSEFLGHKEVLRLHKLVVCELEDQTRFLFGNSWTNSNQTDEGSGVNLSRVVHLAKVSQTLRFCIRILPLVDSFEKNASFSSARLLDGILQQLCQPTVLFHLLGLQDSEDMDSRGRCETAAGDEYGKRFMNTASHSKPGKPSHEACQGILLADTQHRRELIFAMLQVYVDELLLHPDLAARLWNSKECKCQSVIKEQMACNVERTQASLEAAFVHVLLSLQVVPFFPALPGAGSQEFAVYNLSLPAGLILLEKFSSGEVIPLLYIAHIASLLARILNDSVPPRCAQEPTRSKNSVKDCWAGGVNWSYCSQEQLPNCNLKDSHLPSEEVSESVSRLNFASLILEHAILLYMRFSSPLDQGTDNSNTIQYQTLERSLLDSSLSKYNEFLGILGDNPLLNRLDSYGDEHMDLHQDDRQCFSRVFNTQADFLPKGCSGSMGFSTDFVHEVVGAGSHCFKRTSLVHGEENISNTCGLVAALLHLMSFALKCISREVCKFTWLTHDFSDQFQHVHEMSLSKFNEADFDKILQCVGRHLSLCLPNAMGSCSTWEESQCERAGDHECDLNALECAQTPLHVLVQQTIVLFTNILAGEVHRGAPDEVLKEYFHLLESLLGFLFALDGRNDSQQCFRKCGVCCNYIVPEQLPKGLKTSNFLEEMVLSLKVMLQDLSEQQRPMPEFLLFFIFKQLSRRDGLSLVATVFSRCLQYHLDVQQTTIHRTGVFQPEGLISDVLELALSEPTRPYSLFTLIVYVVDTLSDLLPICETFTLPEITESMSWFQNIAYMLSLASQLAVFEQKMFFRNGEELFFSFTSKLSQGIDRILTEGTAAARWLSDHRGTLSDEVWNELAGDWDTLGTRSFHGEMSNGTGKIRKCKIFLNQVDMLTIAVEELSRSLEPLVDSELDSLMERGRKFLIGLAGLVAGSQWDLHLSDQNQHLSVSESESHIHFISADSVLENDHVDCHENEFLQEDLSVDTAAENVEEHARTLERDIILRGDHDFLTQKVSSGQELNFLVENDFSIVQSPSTWRQLPPQQEMLDIRKQSDDVLRFAALEIPLSSVIVSVEAQQPGSATSLIAQKSDTEADCVDLEKCWSVAQEKKQYSLTTIAIIRRLVTKHCHLRKNSTCRCRACNVEDKTPTNKGVNSEFLDDCVTDRDFPPSSDRNLYVDFLSGKDPSGKDAFNDLKGFIVPKEGRDYSVWLKGRQKFRRRLYSKNLIRRVREKKELFQLLA